MRTCIGCRERAPATDLLRVVATGEGSPGDPAVLVPDPRRREPGRGAHVHPTTGCLDLADRRRAFARALRRTGPLDASAVRAHVEAAAGTAPAQEQHDPPIEMGQRT